MVEQIYILGAGNIGFSLGFLLSKEGYRVSLTGRDPIRQIVDGGNFYIKSDEGLSHLKLGNNIRYETQPAIKSDSITIITTKTFDIARCLSEYPQALDSKQLIFLQNGLSPESIFFQYLNDTGKEFNGRSYSGVVFGTARLEMPSTLELRLNKVVIGSTESSVYSNGVLDLSEEICLPYVTYPSSREDYLKQRATKLMYNSTNLLCFLFNMKLGEMAQNKVTRILFKDRIREMGTFFKTSKVEVDIDTVYKECIALCENRFSGHLPSIVQDTYNLNSSGRYLDTEIDQIDRSIVNTSNIPMPICGSLLAEAERMIPMINQAEDKFATYLRLINLNRQKYGVQI